MAASFQLFHQFLGIWLTELSSGLPFCLCLFIALILCFHSSFQSSFHHRFSCFFNLNLFLFSYLQIWLLPCFMILCNFSHLNSFFAFFCHYVIYIFFFCSLISSYLFLYLQLLFLSSYSSFSNSKQLYSQLYCVLLSGRGAKDCTNQSTGGDAEKQKEPPYLRSL